MDSHCIPDSLLDCHTIPDCHLVRNCHSLSHTDAVASTHANQDSHGNAHTDADSLHNSDGPADTDTFNDRDGDMDDNRNCLRKTHSIAHNNCLYDGFSHGFGDTFGGLYSIRDGQPFVPPHGKPNRDSHLDTDTNTLPYTNHSAISIRVAFCHLDTKFHRKCTSHAFYVSNRQWNSIVDTFGVSHADCNTDPDAFKHLDA
jgi:hypothetical protein